MNRKTQICTLNLSSGETLGRVRMAICPTRQRLVEAFSRLQNIQLVRNHRQDPRFGRLVEERIIWRELIELELQEVDEQIERISKEQETTRSPEPDEGASPRVGVPHSSEPVNLGGMPPM